MTKSLGQDIITPVTIHVNIGEAKTRLSELVAAALRGEEVVLAKAGRPQVRLAPVAEADEAERERIATKRRAAFGMYRHLLPEGAEIDVARIKREDAGYQDAIRKKHGDPA